VLRVTTVATALQPQPEQHLVDTHVYTLPQHAPKENKRLVQLYHTIAAPTKHPPGSVLSGPVAGGFVTSVSGIVYEAAEKLSCAALESARPSSIMVTDGLALLLGSSHMLRFAPGGYLLKGPRSIGTSDVGGEVRFVCVLVQLAYCACSKTIDAANC
jgi:hypothetical protein